MKQRLPFAVAKQQQADPVLLRWYREQIGVITQFATVMALTVVLIAQVIYLNLHFIIGSVLTCIAIVSVVFQIGISVGERYSVYVENVDRTETLLLVHFIVNHIFMVAYAPFFIWALVIMIQRASS